MIANKSQPSTYTLNVLAEYTGYEGFDDFKNKHKEDLPISSNEKLIPDEFGINLFNLCLKNHHFDTVIEYLNLLPTKQVSFEVQLKIGESLGKSFRKDKKARAYLLPKLAQSQVGREYFYENFVDIDYLNFYFKDALIDYYLPYSTVVDAKKYLTDVAFAKTIEFIAHLKARKKKKATQTAYDLFQQIPAETHWKEFAHPFPYARFISTYLIYLYLTNNLNDKNLKWCVDQIVLVAKAQSQPSFVFAQLLMALNYCGCHEEIVAIYHDHKALIFKNRKTELDYLPNLNCINNAFMKLNREYRVKFEELDLNFKDITRSSQVKNTLI